MEDFNEDDLFESVAEKKATEKQQKELIAVLRQLAVTMDIDHQADSFFSQSIAKNNDAIALLLGKISELSFDNTDISSEIKAFNILAEQIIQGQKELLDMVRIKPKKLTAIRATQFNNSPITSFEIHYEPIK